MRWLLGIGLLLWGFASAAQGDASQLITEGRSLRDSGRLYQAASPSPAQRQESEVGSGKWLGSHDG
jgi:hypothetical protein